MNKINAFNYMFIFISKLHYLIRFTVYKTSLLGGSANTNLRDRTWNHEKEYFFHFFPMFIKKRVLENILLRLKKCCLTNKLQKDKSFFFIVQIEFWLYRLNFHCTDWIFIVQIEFSLYRLNFHCTDWIFTVQIERKELFLCN